MRRYFDIIKEIFFPRIYCISCGCVLNDSQNSLLCDSCLQILPKNNTDNCKYCGRKAEEGNVCNICNKTKNVFYKAYSPFCYEGAIKELIHKFKYENLKCIKEFFANELASIYNKKCISADIICYVPMTVGRYLYTGYNQGYILAKELGKKINVKVSKCLVKTKRTKKQATLSARERRRNLQGAFKVKEDGWLRDKVVLLVDDVLTTGTTANVLSQAMCDSGAKAVYVLTVASTADKPKEY